ncbi:MAG: serine/threonine protein kinase, partial [Deltaproteobacteria bacterium]|nr:serine/threonine protein kinase [Deltaproteobacteria bacterium]
MSDDPVGQVLLDTYRVTRLLGQGGMGAVYEAQHLRLPKKVAVKVLDPDATRSPELFQRFRREAEVASSLGNSHICEALDFSPPSARFPFIVMEFLDGVDLAAYLEQKGPLPLRQAVRIAREVLSALDAAHARDIVHRDLKPQNIYLCRRDRREDFVKLLDFGISKMKTGGSALTKPLAVLGTPSYMAPEQVQGQVDRIDARTDLWGMGVVLYEMLTGRVAFPGHDMLSAVYRVVFEEPAPITAVRRDVPAALAAVVARAMAKKPEGRYPSAQAMEEELTRAALATGEWEQEEDTAPELQPTAKRPALLPPTAEEEIPAPATLRGPAVAPVPPGPALAPAPSAPVLAPTVDAASPDAAPLPPEPDEPPTLRRRPVAALAA